MRSFFKMFLASFLALVIFVIIGFFIMFFFVTALASSDEVKVAKNSILTINLAQDLPERQIKNPLGSLTGEDTEVPGLYDAIRLIKKAKKDDHISGIYITANSNGNGFAASHELREALLDFKTSKKWIIAHGEMMSQGAYYIASVADKVYTNPMGSMDWRGLSADLVFVKGTLDKLKIEPQIFYAGKFKSATEPFRTDKMTPENREQTEEWLGDLYREMLQKVSASRGIDTATLHQLANSGAVQNAEQALQHKLIDGVKYDDEVKDEFKQRLKIGKHDKLHFMPLDRYAETGGWRQSGKDRIAVIYAEGDIIDGKGDRRMIGSEDYVKLIRKVRLDKNIKAIVLRVNSGGGSALASENIWRELEMAKKDKPVVVSMGDVAASGGYYIAAGADSIFANANTITGSIGVFGIIPNMKGFFNDKLGVTFDNVKTAEYADEGTITRPLNEQEKKHIQQWIDNIYAQFKQRVATGIKRDTAYVDSIAQGRVWSGEDALRLGLVDRIGGLQTAIESAAKLAKLDKYRLREYPEVGNWMEEFFDKKTPDPMVQLKKEVGDENFEVYKELVRVKRMVGSAQTRLPFTFFVH